MVNTAAIKTKYCEEMSGQTVHGIFLLHLHHDAHPFKGGQINKALQLNSVSKVLFFLSFAKTLREHYNSRLIIIKRKKNRNESLR